MHTYKVPITLEIILQFTVSFGINLVLDVYRIGRRFWKLLLFNILGIFALLLVLSGTELLVLCFVNTILWGLALLKTLRRDSTRYCIKLSNRCEQNPKNRNFQYHLRGEDTPDCCIAHLLSILYFTCDLLETKGIPYFICDGTLLGSVRHGGIIPWDTDCDLAVSHDYLSKLRSLRWRFVLRGFWVYEHPGYFTIQYSTNGVNSLHTDINLTQTCGPVLSYDDVPNIEVKDVYPLKRYNFYDRQLWGPNNADGVLSACYGIDYLSVVEKKYFSSSERVELTDENRSPAKKPKVIW